MASRQTTVPSILGLFFIIESTFITALLGCSDLGKFPSDFSADIYYDREYIKDDNGSSYRLNTTVDWTSFNNSEIPGYAIRLMNYTDRESVLVQYDCIVRTETYQYTASQMFTFEDLLFGFKYKMRIRLANLTSMLSSENTKDVTINTPDCYAETGNEEYCVTQPTQHVSMPRDLVVTPIDVCGDIERNVSRLHVSWLAPLQVNGNLTKFTIVTKMEEAEHEVIMDKINVEKVPWNQNLTYRFNCTIELATDHNYTITISPFAAPDGENDQEGIYNVSTFLYVNGTDPPCPSSTPVYVPIPVTITQITPKHGNSQSTSGLSIKPGVLAGLLCATLLLILVIVAFVFVSRRRLSSGEKAIFVRYPDELSTTYSCSIKKDTYTVSTGLSLEADPVFHKMEFDRSLLKVEEILGSGQFGTVYKGFAYGIGGKEKYIPVAVKSLRENATRSMKEDFLDEIKLIVEIGSHPNILAIMGCCTTEEPHYLITELMELGDLLHFLWKCREDKYALEDPIYRLTSTGQLQIAIQIARGMEYLSTTLYYHGDLAARNVLVGKDLICKISDFGLADDIYQRGYKRLAPERKRPVKWVSLETNTTGKCSIQSDVWSYGIVLYEIYTLGGVPYPGLDGRTVITKLQQGYRMEKPVMCPEEVFDLMRSCWFESPHNRPTFTILYNALDAMLTENVDYLTDLENDYSNYEFVPCEEQDSLEEHETTGGGDCEMVSTTGNGFLVRSEENDFKSEAQKYCCGQQISRDSAFSEESTLSGEIDDLHLWWHLNKTGSDELNSLEKRFPSIQFIPIMEYDNESVSSRDSKLT